MNGPRLIVLGIAQDGGVPQAGSVEERGWTDPAWRERVVCLGIVDPASGSRWMIEATPDFPSQLRTLALESPARPRGSPLIDGIFVTHAHIGHYTGLMYLGHEALGAKGVPVFAMPRMREFLRTNGPWSQLVNRENIRLEELADGRAVALGESGIRVTPVLVPHRQEYSEVVGFRIEGPRRRVLFIPDIDSWEEWDAMGKRLEDELTRCDVVYLDGTFFANGEIPGRDMTGFPHPFITKTMQRLAAAGVGVSADERRKVRFIHLNHTNPALDPRGEARRSIERAGFAVAEEGETVGL
jgi:pyrroloquinoline quinone biosynthesis protein B